jgi:PncC family amidohydrolase
MTFEDLTPIGTAAGTLLKARGQSVAVVDGATGGLISAALLAMPGASAYFRGGGVIYTLKGRRMVLGHEPGSLRGLTSATEAYALAQARLIRARYESDWGVAETGAAGMKDMGKVVAALKAKHGTQLDMGKASGLVKAALA